MFVKKGEASSRENMAMLYTDVRCQTTKHLLKNNFVKKLFKFIKCVCDYVSF